MSLFSRATPAQKVAQEVIRRATVVWDTLHDDVIDCAPLDYDKDVMEFELVILTYSAFRIAIQISGASHKTLSEIFRYFDKASTDILHFTPEYDEVLQRRGEQYMTILSRYQPQIAKGDFKAFSLTLARKYDQFCRCAEDKGELDISGDPLDMVKVGGMANQYWSKCFWNTFEYVKGCNLK